MVEIDFAVVGFFQRVKDGVISFFPTLISNTADVTVKCRTKETCLGPSSM